MANVKDNKVSISAFVLGGVMGCLAFGFIWAMTKANPAVTSGAHFWAPAFAALCAGIVLSVKGHETLSSNVVLQGPRNMSVIQERRRAHRERRRLALTLLRSEVCARRNLRKRY